jgi:hypothetical protein
MQILAFHRPEQKDGRVLVVAESCDGVELHRDTIDHNSNYHRQKFIETACDRNGGPRPLTAGEIDYYNSNDGHLGEPDLHQAIVQAAEAAIQAAFDGKSNGAESRITYQRITCAELDGGEFEEEYLIRDVLVASQPLIIAGPRKGLKTSVLVDLALSLATVTPFLGKFDVTRHARTVLMSGESGLSTLQKTARAIAAQKGYNLRDIDGLIWSPDLPKFGHLDHMDALGAFLAENEAEFVAIDPAYLTMPADDAGNLFARGELLRSMVDVCSKVGCMMGLAHHNTKQSAMSYEEPSLDWISWSGFAEFARQWILLGRRNKYEPGTGHHELWLSVGGSAGHSSLWGLNIDEDVFPQRRWQPVLLRPDEVRAAVHEAADAARDERKREDIDRDKSAIIRTVANLNGKPETEAKIRARCGRNGQKFAIAWSALVDEGSIVSQEIIKGNNRKYTGWKLRPDET